MKVTWESGVVASRIAALTAAVVLLIGMFSGATASFANTEPMTRATETRADGSDSQLDIAEDQSGSPELLATAALGLDATHTTAATTSVRALDVPTPNDGFMLIMWLLLIATISTAVTWGLTRWIDPEESDQMDKVHFK